MAWSEADDERLVALWDRGVPSERIGTAMGRTKSAVLGRARRLNVNPRPNPSVEREPKPAPRVVVQPAPVAPVVVQHAAAPCRQPEPLPAPRPQGRPPQPWRLRLVETGVVRECQFPEGEKPYRFCEAAAVSGRPYCVRHCRVAFIGFGHPRPVGYAWVSP
jgi:GcrA cell cycle regulator